jgi:arsenate reductase
MTSSDVPTLLFLCVANSARSQMAEGLARRLAPAEARIYSAGSQPGRVNPFAIEVMSEVGIDLSGCESKGLDAIPLDEITTAFTLCADEICPVFSGELRHLHWPFPDPAAASGTEQDILESFRQVRDAIELRLRDFFAETA